MRHACRDEAAALIKLQGIQESGAELKCPRLVSLAVPKICRWHMQNDSDSILHTFMMILSLMIK